MAIQYKFVKNTLIRVIDSYFGKEKKESSYIEEGGSCIYGRSFVSAMEQRYLGNLCCYYIPKEKKLYLVMFTDALNDKIDYKPVIKSFNDYNHKGEVLAGVAKLRDLWNISPQIVDIFGKLEDDIEDNTLCIYQEFNNVGPLAFRGNVRKFKKALDLYETNKSKKIRSLYNQLGTLVLNYNNSHEK